MTQYLLVILALLSILSYSGPDAAAADPFYHIRIGSPGGNSAGGSSSRSGYFQSTKSGTTSTNTNFSSGGSTSTNLTTGSATGGGAAGPDLTIPNTVTHLVISNKTGNSVTMGLQCQVPVPGKPFIVQDGCTQIIDDMRIINLSRGGTTDQFTKFSTSQGTYPLAAMTKYEIVNLKTNPYSTPANQQQNCLQGLIISFGQWNNCPATTKTPTPPNTQPNTPAFPVPFVPGPDIPNGSNAAEPSLNLPNTQNGQPIAGTGATEGCDITCVNGANSIIQLTITSPSQAPSGGQQALPWTYDGSGSIGPGQSFTTKNSWVNFQDKCDDNCFMLVNGVKTDRPGVFPFGCTQCNVFPDPKPPCLQFCKAENGLPPNTGCTFNRARQANNIVTQQFGGTVEFCYLGSAIPPASCNGLGNP